MDAPKIFESEYRFCLLLWENEPAFRSGGVNRYYEDSCFAFFEKVGGDNLFLCAVLRKPPYHFLKLVDILLILCTNVYFVIGAIGRLFQQISFLMGDYIGDIPFLEKSDKLIFKG